MDKHGTSPAGLREQTADGTSRQDAFSSRAGMRQRLQVIPPPLHYGAYFFGKRVTAVAAGRTLAKFRAVCS